MRVIWVIIFCALLWGALDFAEAIGRADQRAKGCSEAVKARDNDWLKALGAALAPKEPV